jgi:hypothetical protein
MGFLDFFRRPPPIQNARELADFIDGNAAFVVQKGLYEYARARAGHYAKVLFGEQEFRDVMEACRWQAYPLGLAMVAEVVEGELRQESGASRSEALAGLRTLVLEVFDRYPVPVGLDAAVWAEERSELGQRLVQIGLHPRKPVKDIAEPYAAPYVALMPIHQKLRGPDAPTLHNYLRVCLLNIHDSLLPRLDAPALLASLMQTAGLREARTPEP